jgi:FAD/FMN-containing dehydrogenase
LAEDQEEAAGAGVLLDLRRLDQVVQQDALGSWVLTQTGITPAALEAHLGRDGFTLRCHFAGHAASQLSTLFSIPVPGFHQGPGLRRLIAVTAVWPDGSTFRTRVSPRQSVGPDSRSFFARGHGQCAVVTEACLAVFSSSVPSGFETLAFLSLSDALTAAFSLVGGAPLMPLEQALEFDGSRWLLHLWFWGPAACVAVARDRAAHRGGHEALGEARAREFWQHRSLLDTTARAAVPVTPAALVRSAPEPGEFISCFSPSGAILYTRRTRTGDPVFLGEVNDPMVQAWLSASLRVEKTE